MVQASELNRTQVTLRVSKWLERNVSRLETVSAEKAADQMFADTGIRVSGATMRSTASAMELGLFSRNKPVKNINDSFSRDAVMAKAIRVLSEQVEFLAKSLGEDLPAGFIDHDALNAIVSRRTPGKTQGTLPVQ